MGHEEYRINVCVCSKGMLRIRPGYKGSHWMDDGCTDGWMDGWMDGCMDGWMDGWMDWWMDGWMDGWTGGLEDSGASVWSISKREHGP